MPVDGIGYGSYTPLAPKQQDPAQPSQKELAPKADQKATEKAAISNSGTNVDITVRHKQEPSPTMGFSNV